MGCIAATSRTMDHRFSWSVEATLSPWATLSPECCEAAGFSPCSEQQGSNRSGSDSISQDRMKRRSFLQTAAATALLSPLTAQRSAGRPNVILVLTDDQGYGDISSHGNPVLKTPNMDRLRSEGVRLTDFHVTPMCTPTRSQLMTGRACLVNKAMNVSSGRTLLRTDVPTMAEIFAASGYSTGQFGKWHLGDTYPYRPIDHGFRVMCSRPRTSPAPLRRVG